MLAMRQLTDRHRQPNENGEQACDEAHIQIFGSRHDLRGGVRASYR